SLANQSRKAINKVAAALSTIPDFLNAEVFFQSSAIISDTTGWIKVQSTFTASSAFSYLVIGMFSPENAVQSSLVNPSGFYSGSSYYIDDVSIYPENFYEHKTVDTIICQKSKILLSPEINNESGYSWNTGDTTAAITIDQPGLYIVTLTNSNYTIKDSFQVGTRICVDTTSLIVNEHFTKDTFLCGDKPIVLSVINKLLSDYSWNNNETTASIRVSKGGIYIVNHESIGIKIADTFNVEARSCDNAISPSYFHVPSAFSPNKDGHNDEFKVLYNHNIPFTNYKMRIY